jgi:hypothetical protein
MTLLDHRGRTVHFAAMSTGRYEILGKLGAGGMGVVYRARQVELDREVAIKELLPDGELSADAIKRFQREMDVLIGLSHPNIIRLFDAGERDGKLFYVMELLQAADLAAVLKASGPLAPAAVISVLDQILDALGYCHGRGLIHRDIKPHNIMLEPSGRAVLMDFGLVKKLEGTLLTAEGKLLGTPRYFPPESLRGDEATPAGDIWSLGVVAYELLSGERLFQAHGMAELATAIIKQPIVPLAQRRADIPAALAAVVHRMLERPLERRYSTAVEVREALAGVRQPGDRRELEAVSGEMSLAELNPGAVSAKPATGSTRRSTGRKAARASSEVASAAGPTQARSWRVAVVAAAIFFAGIGAWMLMRGGSGAVNVAVDDAPANVRARYEAADRLVIAFETTQPSRWSIEADDSAPVLEPAPATAHRIELPLEPGRDPTAVTLARGTQRVRVALPPSPGSRVLALARALRDLGLDEKVTDTLWEEMRRSVPKWTTERVEGSRLRCTPVLAQEAVAARPAIAAKLDAWAAKVRADGRVSAHLDEVLKTAGALLAADRVPEVVRDELLDLLGRLDLLDGLAEYVGRKPYFGVQDRLEPAIAITVTETGQVPPKLSASRAIDLPHGEKRAGARIYARANERTDDRWEIKTSVDDRPALLEHTIQDPGEPGPAGRRWQLGIHGLSTHQIVHLARPGARSGIPLRLRGTFTGLGTWTVFTLSVTGPLARESRWTVSHRRIFEASARSYFGLDRAAVESLTTR